MSLMHWLMPAVLGALPIALLVSPGRLTAQRDDPPEQISGILEGGWMAIGGEHTGWVLKPDDNPDSVIELDLACCNSEASALVDSHVTIVGRWMDKQYVERGTVLIFVAAQIT